MVNLRPYQTQAIAAIEETFTKRLRQYIEMPTGSGKTITFLSYASLYHETVLIIVPSRELLKQVYETAQLFYHKSQISRKGAGYYEEPNKIHICIINSIRGEYLETLSRLSWDLIVIDEAHHVQANSYKRYLTKTQENIYPLPLRVLGVTATPDRLDGLFLEEILDFCSFKIKIEDLIQSKYLSEIEGLCIKTKIDLSVVDDHNGDFSINQLYKHLNTNFRNNMILNAVQQEMKDRKTLIFCINIDHSKQINALLQSNNIPSAHIDGRMTEEQRARILKSFREGHITCLCNCQLLTEGFDEPSIDGIVLARPTRSRSLFRQMVGRGLRIFPGKTNCKILDIIDNHRDLSGFSELIDNHKGSQIDSFSRVAELRDKIEYEKISSIEYVIEKKNFLESRLIDIYPATTGMIHYLEENNITFFHEISFNEASFLIWLNELKKEYYGFNTKA